MLRRLSVFVFATVAYAQYAASDDGRIVYFSNTSLSINGIPYSARLGVWTDGAIRTLFDSANLETLSTDGQSLLISFRGPTATKWQLLRHGAISPTLEITDALTVAMSRNGRWLAVVRASPKVTVTRLELLPNGTRPAGVLDDPSILAPTRFRSFLSDDGTVNVPCNGGRSCAWDGISITGLPAFFPPGNSGRYLYFWQDAPEQEESLQQYDRASGKTAGLPVRCPKKWQTTYSPSGHILSSWTQSQAAIGSTDVTGTKIVTTCGSGSTLLDTLAGTSTPLPRDPVLNSTMTRILSRPTPSNFAWVPAGTPVPPVAAADTIVLDGPLTPFGVLATAGDPDFTLHWGGQRLPWLNGANGYSYAAIPHDAVPGAVDSIAVTSSTRPWLNTTVQIAVEDFKPAPLPLVAADPKVLFIHGDYRGFVTPETPASRGDYLHFLISGVDPNDVTLPTYMNVAYSDPFSAGTPPGLNLSFPVMAISPTPYDPSITQITIRIPDNAPRPSREGGTPRLSLLLVRRDGRGAMLNASAYLSY